MTAIHADPHAGLASANVTSRFDHLGVAGERTEQYICRTSQHRCAIFGVYSRVVRLPNALSTFGSCW